MRIEDGVARSARRAAVSDEPVEGPWELPAGWRWARLGGLGRWFGGGTPSKANEAFWQGDIPWVSAKDMKRFEIADTVDHISEEALAGSAAKLIPSGSVLCVMRSGILKHSFPVAVSRGDLTINQDLRAIHPAPDIDPAYLARFLSRSALDILLVCSKDGTTVDSIEVGRLEQWPVPIPLLATQRRIVARIDALFFEIEEGERAMAEARVGVETYREALLKAAVNGELTADWRAENPARETGEALLRRLLTDRRTRWDADPKSKGKQYREPTEPETDDLDELPASWCWASVQQLGEVVTGGTPPTSQPGLYGGEIPFFTPSDLDVGREIRSAQRTITPAGLAAIRAIPPGSVMVTCIGATIGKTGHTSVAGATNQQINTIVPGDTSLSDYLFAYFSGPIGRALVIENSSSTTLPILNKGDFSRLPVPLPPSEELLEISRRLSRVIDLFEIAARTLEAANDPAALRQSILAAAFRGDLVA